MPTLMLVHSVQTTAMHGEFYVMANRLHGEDQGWDGTSSTRRVCLIYAKHIYMDTLGSWWISGGGFWLKPKRHIAQSVVSRMADERQYYVLDGVTIALSSSSLMMPFFGIEFSSPYANHQSRTYLTTPKQSKTHHHGLHDIRQTDDTNQLTRIRLVFPSDHNQSMNASDLDQ